MTRKLTAAQATIQAHGDYAAIHAAQCADELIAEGDMEWRRVLVPLGARAAGSLS